MLKKILQHSKYWLIEKPLNAIYQKAYVSIPLLFCKSGNTLTFGKKEKEILEIVVIAYNNEVVIDIQIDKIYKYCKDKFHLTIVDNSPNIEKSNLIREVCFSKRVGYIKLIKQPFFKSGNSHGLALNWVYKNYIKKVNPKYFGFLDHDIFPIKDIMLTAVLSTQPYYGLKHYALFANSQSDRPAQSTNCWYLWAGFCFYNTAALKSKQINFMPCFYDKFFFDTGGSNWLSLYATPFAAPFEFPDSQKVNIREGNIYQSDMVEYIDEKWVHTYNGSYWLKVEKKEHLIADVLLSFEKYGSYNYVAKKKS